jgi:hypothetical protein
MTLTFNQWTAAQECARLFMAGDPESATDRAAYRNAKARLVELLPEGEDERAIIRRAVRSQMRCALAESLAMMPDGVVA